MRRGDQRHVYVRSFWIVVFLSIAALWASGCFDVTHNGTVGRVDSGTNGSMDASNDTNLGVPDSHSGNDLSSVVDARTDGFGTEDLLGPSDADVAVSPDGDVVPPDDADTTSDAAPDSRVPPDVVEPTCDNPGFGNLSTAFPSGAMITGSPAVDDAGAIYFGTHAATFFKLSCKGVKQWSWNYPCGQWGCPQSFEGSPLIDDAGRIIIGDDLAIPNFMFALDADGGLLWTYETQLVYGQMDSSPVLSDDGTLFIGSRGESGWSAGSAR